MVLIAVGHTPRMGMRNLRNTPWLRAVAHTGLGLLLIAGSVLGVFGVIERDRATVSVALAAVDVPAGTQASDMSLEFVEVSETLNSLPVFSPLDFSEASSLVTNRPLRAGDIVSLRDFSTATNLDATAVTVELSIGQPGWLVPGQRVSLWVAPPASENSFSAPFVLSRNVLIESVSQDEGFAADRTVRQVDLLVAHTDIPGIIHALSNSYYLHLVPEMSDP